MRTASALSWLRPRHPKPSSDTNSVSSQSSSIPYHATPVAHLSTPTASTRDPPSPTLRSSSHPSCSYSARKTPDHRSSSSSSFVPFRHRPSASSRHSDVYPAQRLHPIEPHHPSSFEESRGLVSTITPPHSIDAPSPPPTPPSRPAPPFSPLWRKPPVFRRKHPSNVAPPSATIDPVFGAQQTEDRPPQPDGEQVLVRLLKSTLGPKAQAIAVRLANKTPLTSPSTFSYLICQGTEDDDVDIVRRQLMSGRLYKDGMRFAATAWANLLLGDRFFASNNRQRHELVYRRSTCTCIICRVRAAKQPSSSSTPLHMPPASDDESTVSVSPTLARTPSHSAMANFVVRYRLPSNPDLERIGASSSAKVLEIGNVVRLNYRASAKLKLTDEVRELFGHLAYTGPISHEEVVRKVTTIGVHYYLYNKGKKERKVYIQGHLVRLPITVGVIKLGTQPMYMPELGATFCLHRKQIMSIYVGEIVLEGNSFGSFIKTGIHFYIGFGEERGVCPVYPNKALGKARKLGINELLLHHHMVDDLEVKCV